MQFEQFENVENKIERFVDSTIAYLPILIGSIISAFLILIFGLWFIRLVRKLAKKILITKFFTIFVPKYRKKIEFLRFENHDEEVDDRFMHSCGMHDRKYIQPFGM